MKKIFHISLFFIIPLLSFSQTQWEKAIDNYTDQSLPLVNVSVDVEKLSKENYIKGEITIYDKEKRTEDNELANFFCKVRYRGSSSLKYDKKSLAIKLIDVEGEDLDANVFGIRKENDWILDAMAIDRIRMRNRVLFDIWNDISKTPYETDFNGRNGTLGQFVELYLNGEYHGLYCMTDKIDRKLLGLKKAKEQTDGSIYVRGVMYKGDAWTDATRLSSYDSKEPFDTELWNGWELQHPDDYPCLESWKPIVNLIDFSNTDIISFKTNYRKYCYHDNVVDYALFILAYNIIDNCMKNTFLSCPDINVNNVFLITPWDLDCSIGGLYDGSHFEYYMDINTLINNKLYYNLYENNIDDFHGTMKKRWQELSSNTMSPESFNRRLDNYALSFKSSGAWQRECEKWNNNPVPLNIDDELDYVKNWYANNVNELNKLLGVSSGINKLNQNVSNIEAKTYTIDGILRSANNNSVINISCKKKYINGKGSCK